MKTTLTILTSLTFLLGCNYPSENEYHSIAGEWFNQNSGYYVEASSIDTLFFFDRLEISFNTFNQFKIERKIYNQYNNQLLGYRFIVVGTYSINGSTLSMVQKQKASNDDTVGLYSIFLTPTTIPPEIETVTYIVTESVLIFKYPPCDPAANCIDIQTFQKLK